MSYRHPSILSDKNSVRHEQQVLWGEKEHSKSSQTDLNIKQLFSEIIYHSDIMENLLRNVYKIARSHSSVLILGESGTGKELIASAIHRLSPRSQKCFMAINCSAIPENLLEAELFGYEKGAFTGADRKRVGHFAAANEGSVFLDEIGDMPLRLQAKLLRVLQEKKFTPLGSRETIQADLRIIAATNMNLEKAVQAQSFRLDLYYRLNVLPIVIPPLRERKEDINLLLEHFVTQSNRLHPHHEPSWFDKEAKETLCHHSWPGNIRQLQNLVERLVIIGGGGRLGLNSLPDEYMSNNSSSEFNQFGNIDEKATSLETQERAEVISASKILPNINAHTSLQKGGFNLGSYIEELENKFILQALELSKNNKNQAAKLLGLNRTTLVERIKKRKISLPE